MLSGLLRTLYEGGHCQDRLVESPLRLLPAALSRIAMNSYWTRTRQSLIQYRRDQPVAASLTVLVLLLVDIPVTFATARIWRLLFDAWSTTPWHVLREFLGEAVAATLIALVLWLMVGAIAWTWVSDRRTSRRPGN